MWGRGSSPEASFGDFGGPEVMSINLWTLTLSPFASCRDWIKIAGCCSDYVLGEDWIPYLDMFTVRTLSGASGPEFMGISGFRTLLPGASCNRFLRVTEGLAGIPRIQGL